MAAPTATVAGDALVDALSWRAPEPAPISEGSQLHEQLLRLAALATPTQDILDERCASAHHVHQLVQSAVGRSATVHVYGSTVTDLALPGHSDIDVAFSVPDDEPQPGTWWEPGPTLRQRRQLVFERLQDIHALAEDRLLRDLELRAGAKVPVVCFVDQRGIGVDISAKTDDGGSQTCAATRTALEAAPAARPLILALKVALAQAELNKPFHGGVGSFVTGVMVTSALRALGDASPSSASASSSSSSPSPSSDLGVLLLAVLDAYCAHEHRLDLHDPASGRELGGAAWA